MNRLANAADEFSGPEEALCWIAGLGFTLALFWGLAHFENVPPAPPAVQFMDMTAVAVPLDPPPPPRTEVTPPKPAEDMVALAGLDVGRTDSSVHIAVVPPDLEALVPTTRVPPGAIVKLGYLDTNLKPRVDVGVDIHHVYQVSEVDRAPQPIVRVAPPGAAQFFNGARSLRVNLLFVIDVDGRAVSARVIESSGNPRFDQLVAKTVEDQWEFSPAIRRGKKVRCLAQQAIRVVIGGGSPFEAQ